MWGQQRGPADKGDKAACGEGNGRSDTSRTWAELSGRQGAGMEDQAQQDGVLPEMMVLTQLEGEAFRKGGQGGQRNQEWTFRAN